MPEESVIHVPPVDATPKTFTEPQTLLQSLEARKAEFASACEDLKTFGRKWLGGRKRKK